MTSSCRLAALEKLAYYGPCAVTGSPAQIPTPLTVGQALYNIGSTSAITPFLARKMSDEIVRSGLDVNKPAGSLLHAGLGALAGNFISNMLGAGPFMRGVATATGANYGYSH